MTGQYWVAIAALTGWALITIYRMHVAGKAREQVHRERLAMIEKGLVPPPEADPAQFERMMDWHPSRSHDRVGGSLRTGIVLIGVGVGLSVMLYSMNGTRTVGVGALIVILGLAFLVIAMVEARAKQSDPKAPAEKP